MDHYKDLEKRIFSFERNCCRKILGIIIWIEMIINEELYKRIQQKNHLDAKSNIEKLHLFGHICQMKYVRKIKTLMLGIMDGYNRKGRPYREWCDDFMEWCRSSLQELSHRALNREDWKQAVRVLYGTSRC